MKILKTKRKELNLTQYMMARNLLIPTSSYRHDEMKANGLSFIKLVLYCHKLWAGDWVAFGRAIEAETARTKVKPRKPRTKRALILRT